MSYVGEAEYPLIPHRGQLSAPGRVIFDEAGRGRVLRV
jgi:hypothetical protein